MSALILRENAEQQILEWVRTKETATRGFRLLVDHYNERVYWLIRRMVIDHDETDDLVQETFIKIWKNLDGFKGDSSLFTWIYRIATNEALRFLKTKKRKIMLSLSGYEEYLAKQIDGDSSISGNEIQKKLQLAILSLPEKQRLVFNMKYYEELKYEEMSEILGTSVGALKASYHHAVKKIEQFVTDH
ncbi:MAG: RNA polymerase sigma factor [Bacteroidales bacterium]|nr:RNA polymerase sigma factor [Bacteroidales bacterium]